jgi:integrase
LAPNPFLALSFFAGIRSYELLRIEKRDFHIKEQKINIRKEVAKPKRKGKPLPRFLEGLPVTVWKWLDAVDFDGNVDTINYVERRRNLYKRAKIEHWPNSAARHSFATYGYAHFEESGRVKKWTGHRGDDTVFLTNYAGLETKENGGRFFKILPPKKIQSKRLTHRNANRGNWPSDEELLKRLKDGESKTKIAIEVGVSEAAVRNRLRRRGLLP